MKLRLAAALSALTFGSCIVPIGDVEDEGSGGADASSGGSGGSGGAAAAGGAWPDASAGSGGTSTGGASGAGTGGSGASGGAANGGSGGLAGGAGAGGGPGGSGGQPGCTLPVSDDFGASSLSPAWDTYSSSTSITFGPAGGQLVFQLPALVAGQLFAGVYTLKAYDLTGCATFVEVSNIFSAGTQAYTSFVVRSDNDYVEMLQQGSVLVAKRWLDGASTEAAKTNFDPTKTRWWRIRESGGMILFETAPDGSNYEVMGSTSPPFDVKAVTVSLGIGTFQPESNPGDAGFDNFNVPP